MTKPEPSGTLGETLGVVLLAAGGSTRLGQPKQLIPIDGEALVARTARRLLCLQPATLLVVTGCASAEVSDQLSSIAVGVNYLPAKVKGVLIMLCDQWRVDHADLKRLLAVWNTDISDIAVARWKKDKAFIFGPPAVFPRNLFHELESLSGDQGAKRVIEKYRNRSTFIMMENAAFDLDEPADLQQITKP
jgi:molybdenum cofactor cytidylyltransferase